MQKILSSFYRKQEGTVVIYVALLLAVFIGFMALSIDTGHWYAVSNELHNAGDACALRGARAYFPDDVATSSVDNNPDVNRAIQQARATGELNRADNLQLANLLEDDVQTVVWDFQNPEGYVPLTTEDANDATSGYWPPPLGSFKGLGVIVTTRKDSNANGPVNNFFGGIFNKPTTDIIKVSAAALSGVGKTEEGQIDLPLAVGDGFTNNSTDKITLSPNWTSAGGWTSFFISPTNPNTILPYINGTPSPALSTGDSINMNNGAISPVFIGQGPNVPGLVDLWNNHSGDWVVTLPIITSEANYVQERPVLGFATFKIVNVLGPPDNLLEVVWQGNKVIGGAPGKGRYYGLMSVQPSVVK